MTRTVRHSVTTRCPREKVWPLYIAWHDAHRYRPIFHELRWTEGEPWKQGSRLEVEMKFPYPFRVKQVITFCIPGEKVTWINHSMGIATQQEITFTSTYSGETEIASLVDIVGNHNPFSWP